MKGEEVEPIGIAVERSETLSTRSVRVTDDLLQAGSVEPIGIEPTTSWLQSRS